MVLCDSSHKKKTQYTSCVTLDKLADLFEAYLYDIVSNQPGKVALLVRLKSYRQYHYTDIVLIGCRTVFLS